MNVLLDLVRALLADRKRLMLENIALRHQVTLLKRSVKRPRIEDSDRILWIMLKRALKEWRETVHFVKPDTVIKWHRKGFRYFWKRKSKARQPGRPPIPMGVILLIRRMAKENVTWGAPRVVDELALLGHKVAESTVAKYMARARRTEPSQSWRTFLRNHLGRTAACDFFVVPTATFKLLYVFVVLSLDRRHILHVGVTSNPTAQWTGRQLVAAFPDDTPLFLMRDRDSIYGWEFERTVHTLGLRQVISAPKSPWQNPLVERVIGTIRRECTDHVIAFGEQHLCRVLLDYVEYYNGSRTHQSLDGNSPTPRWVEREGEVAAVPHLGGLHHRYTRAA